MNIVMCCTRDWYKYLIVNLFTLFNTNKVNKVYLFLEDDVLEDLNNLKDFDVNIVIINYKKFIDKYIFKNKDNQFTDAALVRLLLGKYIDGEKVLYLDVDALVLSDINNLWKINIDEYYIAGVKDANISNRAIDYLDKLNIKNETYVNSGVLLMNLDAIRENNIIDEFIYEINKKVYKCPDQDVINKVCKNKILLLDLKYNCNYINGYADDMKIIHYVSNKTNWVKGHRYDEIWYKWEKRYYNYLKNKKIDNKINIDLIIPIYNSRKFLKRVLDSVFMQTIKEKVLVTIVDDGSNEIYDDILDDYKDKLNINYIRYKKNKGVGYARKYGLKKTNLEYIAFIDSDDEFYDELSLAKMYNIISNNMYCNVVFGKELKDNDLNINYSHVYGKIYRRSKIEEENINFLNIRCNEDVYFNFCLFSILKDNEIEKIDDVVVKRNNDNVNSIVNNINDYDNYVNILKLIIRKVNKVINVNYAFILLKNLYEYDALNLFKDQDINVMFYKLSYKFYKKVEKQLKLKIDNSLIEENVKLKKFINKISKY